MVGNKRIGRPRDEPAPTESVRQFRRLEGIDRRTENLNLRNRVIRPAKRRRNTINDSSNYDVDYNDNNDYGSPIRFPRRVSPVLPSTSFISLSPDRIDYIDDPEDAVNHTPDSSHSLPYDTSINSLSNLSISYNEGSNLENSTEIHDHVHYSMDYEPSPTQLKQHDNHEVQESIQDDESAEASHSFQHDPTKSLPPNQNLIHCELPSWLGDLNDEKMNNRKLLESEFNDDDSDVSSLNDVSEEDASSGYSSAEGDDDEYENIQEYYLRILGNRIAVKGEMCIYLTHELVLKFWEDVIDLKETRKNIIKELKGKLKKRRKFSVEDVDDYKEIISSIEFWLNKFIPAISKLRATFILGSNKCHVLFQGYKYSRTRQDPSRYKCTYNADPSAENFDYSLDNCLGYLELDEKGYLQPGSYIRHFHDPVKNGDFDQNLAKHVLANFDNVTIECKSNTNQKKFNHFLAEKLRQAIKYNEDAVEIKSREQVIEQQLEKLKLLNDSYDGLKKIELTYANAKYSDRSIVPVEKIFKVFTNIKEFIVFGICDESCFTKETAKEIIEYPNFKRLKTFVLGYIPEIFDFAPFSKAMKQQKQTNFDLRFKYYKLSQSYITQLNKFINEIIQSYSSNYLPPMISLENYGKCYYQLIKLRENFKAKHFQSKDLEKLDKINF